MHTTETSITFLQGELGDLQMALLGWKPEALESQQLAAQLDVLVSRVLLAGRGAQGGVHSQFQGRVKPPWGCRSII